MGQLILRTIKGRTSLVYRYFEKSGRRKDLFIPLDDVDSSVLEDVLKIKIELNDKEIVEYPCTNPCCSNKVPMTKKELRAIFLTLKNEYDIGTLPYCSDRCKQKIIAVHQDQITRGLSGLSDRRRTAAATKIDES